MNPNRWIINETKRWTSLAKKLREENKCNEYFEIMLNNLTLEEVIALKLELSSKTLKSPLYGLPIWKNMKEIAEDAVLTFALSTTQTYKEAASFLGMTPFKLRQLVKKYKLWTYFHPTYDRKQNKSETS